MSGSLVLVTRCYPHNNESRFAYAANHLPGRALFAEAEENWKNPASGQKIIWQQDVKIQTTVLGRLGRCRLPGWGMRDHPDHWLETLQVMAQNRSQWRTCIHNA